MLLILQLLNIIVEVQNERRYGIQSRRLPVKRVPNRYFKKIMVRNHNALYGGTVFFGDSITEMYDIESYYREISIKYNLGVSGFTSETLLWICDEAVLAQNLFNLVQRFKL